jgi:membrane-associated phospholipid phosphatase
MQAGALAAPLTVGAVYAIAGSRPRRGFQIAATGTAAWLTAKAVKRRIRRGRPGDHTGGATLRLGSADEGLGFPSGHAAVAVTLGVSLAAGQGTAAAAAATAAVVVVGVSRVYVGAHYPLDVAGGWALGLVVAASARRSS